MSFAFNEEQKLIRDAIDRARQGNKKVLFFAAASNYRLNERRPVGFPAIYKEVIRVNSSAPGDWKSDFSPKVEDGVPNFSIIGEHLNAAYPQKLNAGNYEKRKNGTSMATAIMAGVAGLVIEFSRLRKVEPNIKDSSRLRTPDGMKAVFRLMLNQKYLTDRDKYLHVKPWELFSDDKDEDRWNIVYEIEKALGPQ